MKKFLLFAFVAVMAMTANAKEPQKFNLLTMAPKTPMALKAQNMLITDGKVMHKAPAKEEAAAETALIEVSVDWLEDEDNSSYNVCNAVYLTKSGVQEEYKGETYEKIHIEGLCGGYATVDGYMSEEKIVIPQQTCYTNANYGDMYIDVALIVNNALEYKEGDVVYVYTDGSWQLEEENAYGVIIRMTGEYEGNNWISSPYGSLYFANGTEAGSYSRGEWLEYTNPIYVEQSEDGSEIYVCNFFGQAALVMYPDSENEENPNSVLIPAWQTISATNSNNDQETYGYDFHILGCDVTEEGRLKINEDKEFINAEFVSANKIAYAEKEYTGIFTLFDADGAGYYMGYQTAISFTLNDGLTFIASPAGIKDVKVSNARSNKLYNLAGQSVAKGYKGIVVMDGKKVIK